MNINAGTNQYNLSLKKMKEEKRPTFATIFDKLDARSKKLNPKNPLNAVMTNDQMYRYYLEETEPMLREIPDDYDLLDDVIGGKSLKDMKLSEFAKLLSGDLDSDRNVKYETLVATISPTPAAPIIPSMISIASPPTPPPSAPTPPPSAPSAPIIPAPSSSVASSIAAPVAVSGLVPTGSGSIPTAPAGTGSAPAAAGSAAITPPAAAITPPASAITPAAASAITPPASAGSGSGTGGRGLTISTAPVAGLTGLLSALSPASLIRASGSAISSVISSAAAAKPSPSGASIPPSAIASGATTIVATAAGTGVAPTPTPVSGVSGALSPTAGAAGGGAAGSGTGRTSPTGAEIAAVALTIASNAGHKKPEDQQAYIDGLEKGLTPPERPTTLKGAVNAEDKDWVRYTIELINYNETADKPFSLSGTQQQIAKNYERALASAVDINDLDSIIQDTITAATIKPAAASGGGKGKGKGKKKK